MVLSTLVYTSDSHLASKVPHSALRRRSLRSPSPSSFSRPDPFGCDLLVLPFGEPVEPFDPVFEPSLPAKDLRNTSVPATSSSLAFSPIPAATMPGPGSETGPKVRFLSLNTHSSGAANGRATIASSSRAMIPLV
jgi:hypothetical protein